MSVTYEVDNWGDEIYFDHETEGCVASAVVLWEGDDYDLDVSTDDDAIRESVLALFPDAVAEALQIRWEHHHCR